MSETTVREEICRLGRSLFERGLTPGSSGNISAKLDDAGVPLVITHNGSNGSWVAEVRIMPKHNQTIAVQAGKKAQAKETLTEAYHQFKK